MIPRLRRPAYTVYTPANAAGRVPRPPEGYPGAARQGRERTIRGATATS